MPNPTEGEINKPAVRHKVSLTLWALWTLKSDPLGFLSKSPYWEEISGGGIKNENRDIWCKCMDVRQREKQSQNNISVDRESMPQKHAQKKKK